MKNQLPIYVAICWVSCVSYIPCSGQQAPLSVRLKRIEGQGNMARSLDFVPGTHNAVHIGEPYSIANPVYDFNKGPIRVEVLDTALLPNAEMVIAFLGVEDTSGWKMYPVGGLDTVYSESTIAVGTEQLIPQWGLLVQVRQTTYVNLDTCDFMLDASIAFEGQPWLTWVHDTDDNDYSNWIRSGTNIEGSNLLWDYGDWLECLEQVLDGSWSAWKLTSHDSGYASPSWNKFKALNDLEGLASVDVVITPDQSKWTRCAVLEIGDSLPMNIGGSRRFDLRQSPSVNKLGQPDGSGTMGMSWFPGYAVNLETGERLNMAFGENSNYPQYGGADMIWNPSTAETDVQGNPIMGGGHYIYVFGHNDDDPNDDMPMYDEGDLIFSKLSSSNYVPQDIEKRRVFKDAMWVAVPLLMNGHTLLENELMIRLRIRKPFKSYQTSTDIVNGTFPMYSFSTANISTSIREEGSAISEVTVWPVPATDLFMVRMTNGRIRSYQLYDVLGQSMIAQSIMEPEEEIQVSTLGFPTGTYLLVIHGDKGSGVRKVLIH